MICKEASLGAYELTVDMLEDLLATAGVAPGEHGIEIRKTAGALVYKIKAADVEIERQSNA